MKRKLIRRGEIVPPVADIVAEPVIAVETIQPLAVTPRDACRMLSIGLTRFYELLSEGQFDDFQVGRSRRVTTASIHAYIDRQRASTRFSQ